MQKNPARNNNDDPSAVTHLNRLTVCRPTPNLQTFNKAPAPVALSLLTSCNVLLVAAAALLDREDIIGDFAVEYDVGVVRELVIPVSGRGAGVGRETLLL
jgi:hypothetical protein